MTTKAGGFAWAFDEVRSEDLARCPGYPVWLRASHGDVTTLDWPAGCTAVPVFRMTLVGLSATPAVTFHTPGVTVTSIPNGDCRY